MASERVFGQRQRALATVILGMVALEGLASVMFLGVYDFDIGALARDPGAFPARGAAVATLLRWGAIVDMLGYLAFAPATLYLYGRLKAAFGEQAERSWLVDLATVAGLGWSLVGAIGAALFASVGPALLNASAVEDPSATAAHVAFAAFATGVNVGLWGTLEWVLLGPWLIGVGWFVRAEGRGFAWLAGIAGFGTLVYAARTGLSGKQPVDLTSPLDVVTFLALSLFLLWALWLAARLWQGR